MDNNKLGLKIVQVSQGYKDLFEINDDKVWTKNVRDIRNDLKNIDNLDGSSAVLMLTSIDSGHILTIALIIEGRTTDFISAWIYIPASIDITGKELVEIVDAVKKEILLNELNDEKLSQLFSKEYKSAPAAKITSKSTREKFAFRYYGQGAKYTLCELLNDIYQPYYRNYKSIFLLDKSSNLKFNQGDNLTDEKVSPMVYVKSPNHVNSFTPYFNGQPFERPMFAVEGDMIQIEWRRNEYESISTDTTVRKDISFSYPTPDQYIKILPYNYITVLDEENQDINEYELFVAKRKINKNTNIRINEANIKNISVEIRAEGFEPETNQYDLTKSVQIKLIKKTYKYDLRIPTITTINNERFLTITISCHRELKKSPIKGYDTKNSSITPNSTNYLKFKPFTRKFWIISLIYSIIVLLLGIWGGYALNDFIGSKVDNQEVSKLPKENADLKSRTKEHEKHNYTYTPKGETDNNEAYSIEAVISYLDSNNKWNRTEMEKFVEIQGLWDALNHYNLNKILQYEKNLKDSKTFKELVNAIKTNEKHFSGTYCNESDTNITIDKYINKLERAVQQQKKETKNKNSNSQDCW